jgi:hypothetical protein
MPEDPEPVADLSGGVYPVAKAVVFFPKVLLSAVTWPSLILHDRRNNILCICTVKCVLLKPLSLFAQKKYHDMQSSRINRSDCDEIEGNKSPQASI